MPDTAGDNQELTNELVQSGAEIAGGVTGAAIGLIGGPLAAIGGAAVGVVVGRALQRVGADIQRRLLGNLFANLVFHPEISAAHAASLIKLAGELTYRQLLALSLGRDVANRTRLRQTDYRGDNEAIERLGIEGAGLLTELYDLYQRGLINGGDGSAWLSVPDVVPVFNVQGDGGVLASLMELDAIPVADRESLYDILA